MNNGDFEVHPRGTAREILLSRELANAIEQLQNQYKAVPHSIMQAYAKLKQHYQDQIDMENY